MTLQGLTQHTQEKKMGKTPYEIRLELLKMSKEMAEQDFFTRKEKIMHEWQVAVDRANQQQAPIPSMPDMPSFLTEDELINKAKRLNNFISEEK